MLVLNRKAGESITIDGQIKIKVLTSSGIVRVGIQAPSHIQIVRDELPALERQHKQKSLPASRGASHENTRS